MPRKSAAEREPGWWGQGWLAHLARCGVEPETEGRRKSALHADLRLAVQRGQVRGWVAMGGGEVEVLVRVKPYTDSEWKRLLTAVAGNAAAAQALLSGRPGAELAAQCERLGLHLFPEPHTLQPVRCTCNKAWNCRHMNALAQQGALLFDANPYLWLEVLGRQREALFAQLRALLADAAGAREAPAEPLYADRYWQTETDPDTIAVYAGSTAAPTALLESLGPLPLAAELAQVRVMVDLRRPGQGNRPPLLAPEERPLDQVLQQYTVNIAREASALALGERPPRHAPAALPGKPAAPGERLALEVESTVRRLGTMVSAEQLYEHCPTAAALPVGDRYPTLQAALPHLPPDLLALAGTYVGERSTALVDAVFEHVVTFDECLRGDFSADADWVRALWSAGFDPPYPVEAGGRLCAAPGSHSLFAELRPEVGDAVTLRVVDPATARLVATLTRRAQRPLPTAEGANDMAAALLRSHLLSPAHPRLAETDAVALLLAEQQYRREPGPGPVWLLPLHYPNRLGWPGRTRVLSADSFLWQPEVARPQSSYPASPGRAVTVPGFTADLMHAGLDRREVEAQVKVVERWCNYWGGPQDTPAAAPSLGHLLVYLWIVAPQASPGAVALPATLARWFRLLAERVPALQGRYEAHIRACEQAEAYAHRCRTRPDARSWETRAWQAEGYRWIGAALCFPSAGT